MLLGWFVATRGSHRAERGSSVRTNLKKMQQQVEPAVIAGLSKVLAVGTYHRSAGVVFCFAQWVAALMPPGQTKGPAVQFRDVIKPFNIASPRIRPSNWPRCEEDSVPTKGACMDFIGGWNNRVRWLVPVLLGIVACVPAPVWRKTGGTQAEYSRVNYQCLQESQQRAAAARSVGYQSAAVDKMVTNPDLYSACMNAHGWYLTSATDSQSTPAATQRDVPQPNQKADPARAATKPPAKASPPSKASPPAKADSADRATDARTDADTKPRPSRTPPSRAPSSAQQDSAGSISIE